MTHSFVFYYTLIVLYVSSFIIQDYRILVRNELVIFADDEDEIRCRKRLSDLMKNYYLSDKRISEINRLFEKEDENANDQSYKNS